MAPKAFLFSRLPNTQLSSGEVRHERPRTERPRPTPLQNASDISATSTTSNSQPTTPSSPVIIPIRNHVDNSNEIYRSDTRKERHHSKRSHQTLRNVHLPDAIPPSVAALLAMTSIPPQKTNHTLRARSDRGQRLTVEAILQQAGVTEKDLCLSLGKSTLELLLSPSDEINDDECLGSEHGEDSIISSGTMSSDSIPSLEAGSLSETPPSLGSFHTPGSRGRRSLPTRRIQYLSSPPSDSSPAEDHPLAVKVDLDELDFRILQQPQETIQGKASAQDSQGRKSAFKSNLTASLKALRSAARSLSTLTTPIMTPDDFLIRSIMSPDSQVPFANERMPPRLEDTPTPALRRYLNPTTNAPIEAHVSSSMPASAIKCTASIQMQTYKVSRSKQSASPVVISKRTQPTLPNSEATAEPVARQRDMRENSDFIRIAVMEMAMRRKGKLDDQKSGRAKWALPPRISSTKPYEIGEDGIPTRWVPTTMI